LLLLLYLGCTTYQRYVPFGYLVQLLLEGWQSPVICFLISSVTSKEAEGPGDCQWEVPIAAEVNGVGESGESITANVQHSWRPFWRTLDLGLLSSTAQASGHPDYRNSTLCYLYAGTMQSIHIYIQTNNIMTSPYKSVTN
jgi:hypothetical protein